MVFYFLLVGIEDLSDGPRRVAARLASFLSGKLVSMILKHGLWRIRVPRNASHVTCVQLLIQLKNPLDNISVPADVAQIPTKIRRTVHGVDKNVGRGR